MHPGICSLDAGHFLVEWLPLRGLVGDLSIQGQPRSSTRGPIPSREYQWSIDPVRLRMPAGEAPMAYVVGTLFCVGDVLPRYIDEGFPIPSILSDLHRHSGHGV